MLSIGSRDEDGKKLGLVVDGSGRLGIRRGDMEQNELADDDIDPDSLSYIDEKIKHVLGHFQKEFEGGVSAESLGAKFGGYGSFLPAYQRSPSILSQPKSPVKIPNHNVSRSPYNLQPQDGHQNPSVLGTTPITEVSVASGGQLTEKSGTGKTSIITHRSEGISQSLSKPVNICDQKMLKVRIKVGHDDGFPRTKPDIYSDLGLDVSPSPSPSLEDTPDGSEECSTESPDAFLESPTTILQIMTCFSVPGGYILSPLSDRLQHSNGKEDVFLANFKTGVLPKGQTEHCTASSDTSLNLKFVDGSTCKKKIKAGDKSQLLTEADGLTCKGDMMTFFKKENEAETAVAQKVIYNDPDMSHSSRARCGDAREEKQIIGGSAKEICNTAGNFKDSDKVSPKERIPISNLSMRNDFAGNSVKKDIHSNGEVNSKSGLTIKSFEERIVNNQDTSNKPAESGGKVFKNYNTTKADSRRYNSGRKNHTTEHEGPANHNPAQKAASCEKDLLTTIQEMDQAYEGGKVPKGIPTNDRPCAEPSKENLRTSSMAPKEKNEMSYESKLNAHKLHKKVKKGKAIESRKGFRVSTHIQKVDENKHTCGSSRFIEKSKGKLGPHKVDNLQIANSATNALAVAPLACNAPTSDAPVPISASVIKDNWVFCDLCQTWRLLPYGTNPDNLPKKWQCSMQVWLPGLNKCYISEDETTKAFHRLYQVLAPVNGTDLNVHPDAAVSGITSDDILNHNGRLENNAYSIPSSVNRKHELMDASNLPNGSSSSGKNLQASSENRSLNDVIRYSLETDSSIKHRIGQRSRSTDLTIEKRNHKVEQKPSKIQASCPDEGDLFGKGGKKSRSKSRRQVDLDGHRSSKKIKKDGLHYSKKGLHTQDEKVGKVTVNGDCDLPPRASRKVLRSSGDPYASKDYKSKAAPAENPKESVGPFSNGEQKENVSVSDTEKLGKYDSKDKKRGIKELQYSGTHRKNSMISQQLVEDRPMINDDSSESKLRRQKKAKVAESEGQDSSAVIVNGKMDKKGCLTRIKLSSSKKYQPDKVDEGSIHAFECVDAMKRDVTNVQLVTAATSSSSKVSGSQKSKVNLQEARESPVDSVSSSPMRMLNTQNNSTKVSLSTKDDILSIGPSLKGDPKSIYNGDVDASDQSGTMTKDPASKSCLRISNNSKAAEPGVLDSLSASHDYQGRKENYFSVGKTGDVMYLKRDTNDFGQANVVYDDGNVSNQLTKYTVEQSDKNHACDQNEHRDSGHQKFGKSSSHGRETKKYSTFGANKDKPKILDLYSDHKELDHLPSNREDNLKSYSKQHNVHDLRVTATGESYTESISQEYQKLDHSNQIIMDRSEGSSGKVIQTSHTAKGKQEKNGWGSPTVPMSMKETNPEQYHVDAVNGRASKSAKILRKSDGLNEVHSNVFPQPSPTVPDCSSMKKDGHITVKKFIQEARYLKHAASRKKNEGLEHESSGMFFEASLKFLHVASLMEPPNTEFGRQGELFPSAQMLKMYVDTAMFCEFCAREYENLKEMAAAALAYKCAEVAYMKVAYFKHPSASKDRHELQAALGVALPGESPSPSASDADILNNQGGFEKAASARATGSPQVAANYVIAARNCSHVKRLLIYTNYLNCAFDAANKSRNAIAAASIDLDKYMVGSVCSVRKVLDFNFNNVEGLLQLVRGSLNSISR